MEGRSAGHCGWRSDPQTHRQNHRPAVGTFSECSHSSAPMCLRPSLTFPSVDRIGSGDDHPVHQRDQCVRHYVLTGNAPRFGEGCQRKCLSRSFVCFIRLPPLISGKTMTAGCTQSTKVRVENKRTPWTTCVFASKPQRVGTLHNSAQQELWTPAGSQSMLARHMFGTEKATSRRHVTLCREWLKQWGPFWLEPQPWRLRLRCWIVGAAGTTASCRFQRQWSRGGP